MGNIGIYGGSFNPVHTGHVLAMKHFVHSLSLDALLVIPAGVPPHKSLAAGSPDGDVRANLLRLAVEDIPEARVDVRELKRQGKSYTYDTLCSIRDEHPDDKLFLLMGTDMILSFDQWYRFEDILKMADLAVLDRYGCSDCRQAMLNMKSQLEQLSGNVLLLDDTCEIISSTTARRMLVLGCGEGYVPAKVLEEIKTLGLYGTAGDYKGLSFDALEEISLSLHDQKRVPHAKDCSRTAVELAVHYGVDKEDAARAGILHDITKALGAKEQLRLCEKYGIMTDEYSGEQTKLLHGKTAAAVAEHVFGENPAVCSAVSWHTTGRAGMSMLEKIIYIADYIEPNRDFPGVDTLRKLAFSDIDSAVLLGINMTIETLLQNGRPLNRHSVEAKDFLMKECGSR